MDRRGWRLNLLLLIASSALTVLAAELVLALSGRFKPQPRTYAGEHQNQHRGHFVPDPHAGWKMRPGSRFEWEVDGVEVPYAADEDGFRAAAVEDPAREAEAQVPEPGTFPEHGAQPNPKGAPAFEHRAQANDAVGRLGRLQVYSPPTTAL